MISRCRTQARHNTLIAIFGVQQVYSSVYEGLLLYLSSLYLLTGRQTYYDMYGLFCLLQTDIIISDLAYLYGGCVELVAHSIKSSTFE